MIARVRARYREYRANVLIPLQHPCVEIVVLVEEARQITNGGQYEEATEETDANHQALQFVGAFAIDFHDCANAEQWYEAGHQE